MTRTLLALALAAASMGCTASVADEAVDDLGADVEDPAGKEDGVVRPIGTFEIVEDGYGIQQVTLFTDKTYHIVERLRVRCAAAPCNPITRESEGTYRYTKSGRSRYIRFTNSQTRAVERYRYTFSANTEHLTLRHVVDGAAYEAIEFDQDAHGGWCNTDDHCAMQELPGIRCLGGHWECSDSFECVPAECSAN